MLKLWVLLLTTGILRATADQTSKKSVYGPLCWGPGIWPHPEHCRLFTICHLKYEVKGQLYSCPKNTGFSTKHLKCIPEEKVPSCSMSVFNEDKLSTSTAILLPVSTGKPDTNLCYKNRTSTPFCLDEDALVVCGPREAYITTVSCAEQSEVGVGRCDKYTRTCVVDKRADAVVDSDITQPTTTSPYVTHSTMTPLPYVTTPSPSSPSPITVEDLHNITTALLEEIASSNMTLFTETGEDTVNTSTTESTSPTLPPTEQISCKVPGLQCYDNTTIIDCPDDLSEPNFVMSCSNIIQTTEENATGYCNSENPTCVLMVQNFLLNLEISNFNFGDQGVSNSEMEFAGIDEDYEGPELYDSDNLRESPDDFFGGLSWFRKIPKSGRVLTPEEIQSNNRKAKMSTFLENGAVDSSRPKDSLRRNDNLGFYGYFPRVKHPKSIEVRADVDDLDHFLAKCQQGGLYCFDNATLVACAGDADSPTYAVQCYAEATSPNGRRLEAFCDQTSDSCVVNVLDSGRTDNGDDRSRNVEVISATTTDSANQRRPASLRPTPSAWRAS